MQAPSHHKLHVKRTWRSDSLETTSFLPLKKCGRKSAAAVHETRKRFAHYFACTLAR